MSIDTVFKPLGPLVLVGVAAVQPYPLTRSFGGGLTYRVRNTAVTAQYFAWGPNASVAAPVAPTAGVPSENTIGMLPGSVETFELPPGIFVIGNAGSAFEFLGGSGA